MLDVQLDVCSFSGLILPNDPNVAIGFPCPSPQSIYLSIYIFLVAVMSSDLKFLQTLDKNEVSAVLWLHYCLRFLVDVYLVSNVNLIYGM